MEEVTLRAEEVDSRRTFVDTTHVEAERFGPPLVDVDWHAFCEAICQGIEGQELETMCYHYPKDLHRALGTKKPGENQKARALWAMNAAKDAIFMTRSIKQKDTQGRPQSRWRSVRLVGRALLGGDVAFSGSVGCCGFACDCQHLECPDEVWAVRRALLLPQNEGNR